MSNVTELYEYMEERGLRLGGLTPGPNATPENVAGEILKSLKAIEAGDFTDSEELNLDTLD